MARDSLPTDLYRPQSAQPYRKQAKYSLVEGVQGGGGGYLGRAGRVKEPAWWNMGVSGRGKALGSGTSGMALGVIGLRTWTPRVSWDRLNLQYARRRKRMSCNRFLS